MKIVSFNFPFLPFENDSLCFLRMPCYYYPYYVYMYVFMYMFNRLYFANHYPQLFATLTIFNPLCLTLNAVAAYLKLFVS